MKTRVKFSSVTILPFLILTFSLLVLFACSGDEEDAVISISLGDGSLPEKATVSIDQLVHTITLSGPTGALTLTIPGEGTARATVVAGLWHIDVKGYYGKELYSTGSTSVDVKARQTTDVSVKMTIVWKDPAASPVGPSGPGVSPVAPPGATEDGSAAYPFKVYDEVTLQKVGTGADGWGLDKNYIMTGDITLTAPARGGSNFTAIGGGPTTPFTGIFDGNDKKILNLTINKPTQDFQGLFGYISGNGTTTGIVKKLVLEGGSVSGYAQVGGVVGWNDGGMVQDCNSTVNVIGDSQVGGVVGGNNGTMENCSATGSVEANENVGGVVGFNHGKVENCNAAGDVEGTVYVGGVAGFSSSTVESCSATGNVNGTITVGGVVGYNQYRVESCSATGDVTGTGDYIGGVVGFNEGMVKSCDAAGNVIGTGLNVGGVVGENWDTVENCSATGNVSGTSQVGGVVGENKGTVQSCDAAGNVIGTGDTVGGVVGSNHSTVENCKATGNVEGTASTVGGVVGMNWDTVENCSATGNVTGTGDYIGGVVGLNHSTVENCNFTTGTVSGGNNRVGGVVGYNDSTVENCYAMGSVEGTGEVGGVVGLNASGSMVEKCYATNISVVGNNGTGIGGVVGGNNNGVVENCYATEGDVVAVASGNNCVGGVVGDNYFGGTVKYCYATVTVEGYDLVGGVVGYNESTVENCAALNDAGIEATILSMPSIHRVVGQDSGGTMNNNYGLAGMDVTSGGVPTPTYGSNLNDETGMDVIPGFATGQYNDQFFWEDLTYGLGWDFASIWEMSVGSNSLPVLK